MEAGVVRGQDRADAGRGRGAPEEASRNIDGGHDVRVGAPKDRGDVGWLEGRRRQFCLEGCPVLRQPPVDLEKRRHHGLVDGRCPRRCADRDGARRNWARTGGGQVATREDAADDCHDDDHGEQRGDDFGTDPGLSPLRRSSACLAPLPVLLTLVDHDRCAAMRLGCWVDIRTSSMAVAVRPASD